MSDMNQRNITADVDTSKSSSENNSTALKNENGSNNLDVLLLAAQMVTSPTKGAKKKKPVPINSSGNDAGAAGDVPSALTTTHQQPPVSSSATTNSNNCMAKCWPTSSRIASDIFHAGEANSSDITPTVTPPFTIELVDDIPVEALPIIQNSTAPPKMKSSSGLLTSGGGMNRRGTTHPFALPLKKRLTAAQKIMMRNVVTDDQQQDGAGGQLKQLSVVASTTTAAVNEATSTVTTTTVARQDSSSSSSSSSATKKKKYRKPQCSHPTCTNRVMNQGVCARHGARVRTCSVPDCTKYAQKGGVCIRHGAVKEYKRCLVGGCNSRPVGREGVCARHVGIVVGKLYYFCALIDCYIVSSLLSRVHLTRGIYILSMNFFQDRSLPLLEKRRSRLKRKNVKMFLLLPLFTMNSRRKSSMFVNSLLMKHKRE